MNKKKTVSQNKSIPTLWATVYFVENKLCFIFVNSPSLVLWLWIQFNETGRGSECSQAIMLVTDGAVDTYDAIFAKYNWPERKVMYQTHKHTHITLFCSCEPGQLHCEVSWAHFPMKSYITLWTWVCSMCSSEGCTLDNSGLMHSCPGQVTGR